MVKSKIARKLVLSKDLGTYKGDGHMNNFFFWVAYFIAFGRLFNVANLRFLQPITVFWQPDIFPVTSGQVADRKEH